MRAYKNFGYYLTAIYLLPIAIVSGVVNGFVLESGIAVIGFLICLYIVFPVSKELYVGGRSGARFVLINLLAVFLIAFVLFLMKLVGYSNGVVLLIFMLLGVFNSWIYMKNIYDDENYKGTINKYME